MFYLEALSGEKPQGQPSGRALPDCLPGDGAGLILPMGARILLG